MFEENILCAVCKRRLTSELSTVRNVHGKNYHYICFRKSIGITGGN